MTQIQILNFRNTMTSTTAMLLAGIVAGVLLPVSVFAQSNPQAAPQAGKRAVAGTPVRYKPDRFAGRAGKYYSVIWGVDSLSVKAVESGELIRFSYTVLDPNKARILNDKKAEPGLIDSAAGIRLVIPTLEKVGQLRQSNAPEAGRSYWMAFSNPHRTVKRGDRVNVVIGQFHADGLVVE